MPDRQREAVYQWEDHFFVDSDDLVEESVLQEIFNDVVELFDLPAEDCSLNIVKTGAKRTLQRGYKIHMIPAHMKPSILIHELAHVIVYDNVLNTMMDGLEGHGPEWLTTYMMLLIDILDYEASSLIASAKINGLRFFEETIRSRSSRNLPTLMAA